MGISRNAFIVAASTLAVLSVAGCGRYVNESATAGDPAPSLALPPAPASVVATQQSVAGVTLTDEPLDPNAVGVQVTSANTVVSPPTVASTVPPASLPTQTTQPQTTVSQAATTEAEPAPTAATESIDYTVKDGDTLSVIAQNNGVGLSSLAAFNGISDRDTLKPGQVIQIPQ